MGSLIGLELAKDAGEAGEQTLRVCQSSLPGADTRVCLYLAFLNLSSGNETR